MTWLVYVHWFACTLVRVCWGIVGTLFLVAGIYGLLVKLPWLLIPLTLIVGGCVLAARLTRPSTGRHRA